MDRRRLLRTGPAAAAGFGRDVPPAAASVGARRGGAPSCASPASCSSRHRAGGSRPVAPNAYAPYRGYGATDPVLRVRTAQGLEGIGCYWGPPEALGPLLGLDPFELFAWDGDTVRGVAEPHAALLDRLAGADVALFDLLGKAARPARRRPARPAGAGERRRSTTRRSTWRTC